jgi:hypothetical protein
LSFTFSRKHTFYFVCLTQGTPSVFFLPRLSCGPWDAAPADPPSLSLSGPGQ